MKSGRDLRLHSLHVLESWDVPPPMNVPPIDPSDHKHLRHAAEIVDRLVIQFALGGLAHDADPGELLKWLHSEGIPLSEVDLRMFSGDLSDAESNECSWKTESVVTLAWAGGIVSELDKPSKMTDWSEFFPLIPPEVPMRKFRRQFKLRSTDELLQAVDVYYLLHAALRHTARFSPDGPQLAIVQERRHALEWVVDPGVAWEEVSLDT